MLENPFSVAIAVAVQPLFYLLSKQNGIQNVKESKEKKKKRKKEKRLFLLYQKKK